MPFDLRGSGTPEGTAVAARPPIEQDSALALAVVASSPSPLVLLDGESKIVIASGSFARTFQVDPAEAVGLSLFELRSGEWDVPQLRALLKATAAGSVQIDAYEMDMKGARAQPRRLVISVVSLDYGRPDQCRLLLSVTDVTDRRLADKAREDLLREKAVLLQEVQHRVANSLQIIASVILQSARKAQSEETAAYLRDAHHRVMSVGALQQQLAKSGLSEVALRPYFEQLCESIGASMIRDHDQIKLVVEVDNSSVGADASVSLGLIVTELVINCLKHAFPGRRHGRIVVGYQAGASIWSLSVADDGVGMPHDSASSTPGLGTSIVEALARQLEARVEVVETPVGTTISVTQNRKVPDYADSPAAA
jgi:two-component system, sensor histidine kinase PdtaS